MRGAESGDGKHPLTFVLVLNYNGISHLDECLSSLSAMDYPDFRVVMVDNASTDGSLEYARTRFPSIEVLRNGRNLQFAAGMNVGMDVAAGKDDWGIYFRIGESFNR